MKKILISVSVLGIVFLLNSYKVNTTINSNVLSILGYTKSDAERNIMGSIYSGSPWFLKPNNLASLVTMAGGDKAQVAKDFCVYVKSYVNSQEFKDKYEAYRQSMKPSPITMTEEEKEMQKEMIAMQQELFTEETLEMLPAEARANAQQSLEDLKASADGKLTSEQLNDWEKKVPANPYAAIKKGLEEFLTETKDVDFTATTSMKDSKKIFNNPVYERKGLSWKACYRAGKEVTEVTRSFAQEWLAELN